MQREFLKGLELEADVVDKIMTEYGKSVNGLKKDLEGYEGMKSEHEEVQKQFQKLQEDLKAFEASETTIEDLKKSLKDKEAELEQFKADTEKRETTRKVQGIFGDALSKKFSPDAVKLLLKTESVEDFTLTEAGEIVDIESKITRLAEQNPTLVLETTTDSKEPNLGGKTPDAEDAALRKAMGLS